MSKKIVIALGGNAILQPGQNGTFNIQKQNIDSTTTSLKEIIDAGHQVSIVHGNGPQVGQILQQNELAANDVPVQPLHALNAQSQGYIGYILQQSLKNVLSNKNIVTLLTMVEVDANDKAFQDPQKPIGMFYSEAEAHSLSDDKGWIMGEDAGRGYRRLVASPKPQSIIELDTIETLLNNDTVVISTGGGGIPVIKNEDGHLEGIAAVIDKDLSALRLAEELNADVLMILTDVPNVYINYGKENQKKLESVSLLEMESYVNDNQFAAGSMGPKVEACIKFAKSGGTAIICSLDQALLALQGKAGTTITN